MIWGVTTFFRFFSSPYRIKNFEKFRNNLKRQGIPLAVIEIVGPGVPFILHEGDCDLLIQLKTDSILWHKERSLNILIESLPTECEYVAWFDADCILHNDDWPEQAKKKLETHSAVQLCSQIQFLAQDGSIERERGMYVYNATNNANMRNPSGRTEGAPGFCWMMKREIIQQIQLYDKAIIGGGDVLFAGMAIHRPLARSMLSNGESGTPRYKDYLKWSTNARHHLRDLKRATYLEGNSSHLWHDEKRYRIYGARHFLLLLEEFNPKEDMVIEKDTGLYYLVNERIRRFVETYFWFREQEKTPEHDKLFDVYELLMLTLKDAGQIKQSLRKKKDVQVANGF